MSWNSKFHPQAARDLYKLAKKNKPLGKVLLEAHVPKILKHPFHAGRKKKGPLAHVWGYGFTFSGASYRIIYTIHGDFVRFIAFGLHDVAYRQAEGRA